MTDLTRKPESALDDEQASRQTAEATLAKDLAEQLYGAWAGGGGGVYVEPTTRISVAQEAIRLFNAMHTKREVKAELIARTGQPYLQWYL